MQITDEHVAEFHEHGFVAVEGFLTSAELSDSLEEFHGFFPSYDEFAADRPRYSGLSPWVSFPFAGGELATLATHPELLSGIERILGTSELQFGGADIGAKYAGVPDRDQDLHVDGYATNSLAYPSRNGKYGQLQIFYYLSDVSESLAPTYVVPTELTRDEFLVPPDRSREDFPRLYELERPALVRAGTLLIMSMRTFHRGSAIRAEAGARFVMALTYHGSAATWMGNLTLPGTHAPGQSDAPELVRWLERATPRQREAVGFPAVGHPYWDAETVTGMAVRFPGMDMSPYQAAVLEPVD